MAQLTVPSAPKEYATHYETLLGVDFQADQTQVDRRRSPDMVNMISDFGGNPIKRYGYRRVGSNYASLVMVDGKMYGVQADNSTFSVKELELDGYTFNVVGSAYTYAGNVGTINNVFVYQKCIYTIASYAFVCFDTETTEISLVGIGTGMMSTGTLGASAPNYPDNIPDTIIALNPGGTGGAVTADDDAAVSWEEFCADPRIR